MFRLIVILGLAVTTPSWAAAQAPDAPATLAGIQAFYANAQDLKAEFTQVYTYTVYGREETSKGRVFFKKPGKMRWDYTSPTKKLFIADGKTLWVYEPEQSQYFKRSLASSQLPTALTFMSGKGNLADEFDAKLLKTADAESLYIELIPKKDEGSYKSLRLLVDAKTFAVKASTVVDPVGNTNKVIFSKMKTNSSLPDSGFSFTPPAGVREVAMPKR